MTLRIAFCGPNLQLNEALSHVVKDLVYEENLEFIDLVHPMLRVTELTKRDPGYWADHNIDWMNMWSESIRRMDMEGAREIDVVLSASCGIEQVCLQATWMGEQVEAQKRQSSLLGPSGENILGDAGVWINRSGSVLQALLNSSEEEVHEYWDFVYAVLPAEAEIDDKMLPLLMQYRDFLASVPSYQVVIRLPENQDAATDALKIEAEKWKAKLASS